MTLTEYQDLNDKVGEWHRGDSPCSLRDYLGLTREQMSAFLSGKVDGVPITKTEEEVVV